MSASQTRTAQIHALFPLGLMLGALACLRVHQVGGHDWALWMALLAVACGTLSAGYLIGHAIPASVALKSGKSDGTQH